MRPYLIMGALLFAGSALTAVVPVLPKSLLPPSVGRPENHQLDGAVQHTLTVGSRGSGSVAARVVEITDDVTVEERTNEVARKRRRREAEQPRRRDEYGLIDRYDGPFQDEYEQYQDVSQNEFLPEDIEEVRYSAPQTTDPSDSHQAVPKDSPYDLFPASFHELLDIPIHVYKNGTEVRTHERPPSRPRQPTVSGGYANTNLQGYGSGGSNRPPPRPVSTNSRRTTTTTRRPTTRRPETLPPRRTQPPRVTEEVHFVTTTPRARIVTPSSGVFDARAPDDRRRPVTVKPSHELPDRVSAFGFGFGAANGGEAESKPEAPRAPLHQQLAFGRRPVKTRKRVPYIRRPSSDKKKHPVVDWSRNDEEEREAVENEESEDVAGAFSEYFAANTDFGAGFGNFGQKKDAAVDFTTTTTTTTTSTTTTTTRRPVEEEQEVYHVTPSAVEPPSWQQWTTPRPVEEHKKSHKKPIFQKPAFQQANIQQDVGVGRPSETPSQQEDRISSDQPFSQPIDPSAQLQDPFSQGQGPTFSSPQEPVFNPYQQQVHQQQFQPATPDREASISVTSGPNLSAGPGSGIQQLPGPTFGGQAPSGPLTRPPRPFVTTPPRPFVRPPNRPPRPGRPQRPTLGGRPLPLQQNKPAPPTGGRPVAGFAGRPPAPLDNRPVQGGDARPGSRPRRPPPTKKPSGGGYLDGFLSWFRGGSEEEGPETRPFPPNARPGPAGARPQDSRPRPQPIPNRRNESPRPASAPQGFPHGFGGGPSAPFTPPPPPHHLPGHGPEGNPNLERAPGNFVRRDPPPASSGTGFGAGARPAESFGVLPQFRPGVAGAPRLAHRRRGTVQRRRGPAASARLPTQQTVKTKIPKPSSTAVVSERAPESATDYLVATPAPRRRRPMRPRPSASQTPPHRRVGGRPASEDARPPLVGQPTARPATLLNEKRIMVVGPFVAPPPGAPYIQHPEQALAAARGESVARNASPARRVQDGDGKMSGKPVGTSAKVTGRVVTGGAPTSVGVGAKLSFSTATADGAAVKAASSPTVVRGEAGVAKAPSQQSLEVASPEVNEAAEGNTGEFREPELYSGFQPILN